MSKAAVIDDGDPQGPDHVQRGTTDESGGTPTDEEDAEDADVDQRKWNADSCDLPLRNTRSRLGLCSFCCDDAGYFNNLALNVSLQRFGNLTSASELVFLCNPDGIRASCR